MVSSRALTVAPAVAGAVARMHGDAARRLEESPYVTDARPSVPRRDVGVRDDWLRELARAVICHGAA
jgi:hypothetical protein